MLFSVLMANYNNSRYLDTAIRSLLAQSHQDWELILVDDASTDNFTAAVAPFLGDKRIKIFRNDRNAGCGYTKARCAAEATGVVAGFLDPDDALAPEALSIMAAAHLENPSCSLIHSTHYICDDKLEISRVAEYPRALPDGVPYLLLNDGRIHHFATFKMKAYDQTDGISPLNKRAVDQDLYYKLEETGSVLFINKPLYLYRIHSNSISNSGSELQAQLNHYAIIEEACQRRIRKAKGEHVANDQVKHYRTRYHKTRLFHAFKEKRWLQFAGSFLAFSVTGGGMVNLASYVRKLPFQGAALLKRSFVDNYEIKP